VAITTILNKNKKLEIEDLL